MFTKTTELAIQVMIHLALRKNDKPISPRVISTLLEASPSYMSKVTGLLVKNDLLKAFRGTQGGVILGRPPESITLLAIVESCEGLIIGNYCEEIKGHPDPVCSFHQAMLEVHQVTIEVLSRWSLADLVERPVSTEKMTGKLQCKMAYVCREAPKEG